RHFFTAFAHMGVPKEVKTDNGPCYMSSRTKEVFDQWGIQHLTGIPHSSTGQAVVEHAHCM
ncbi:POK10 protein, partial [Pachyramphus minor]|nr:POK10 protein [Pachyramphus minor]